MVVSGEALRLNMNQTVESELGIDSVRDINRLCSGIRVQAKKLHVDTHLVLVGGSVRPEKRGLSHKDVDLKLYSPQLASESFMGGECPKFDKFALFVSKVGESLGWGVEVVRPWFNDYEMCGDGKVVLHTGSKKPIEVLPVRDDYISGSFEEYLKRDTEPHLALF